MPPGEARDHTVVALNLPTQLAWQYCQLPVPKATHQVVIHHAYGLHVGVTDRGAHEREAALFQIPGQGVR